MLKLQKDKDQTGNEKDNENDVPRINLPKGSESIPPPDGNNNSKGNNNDNDLTNNKISLELQSIVNEYANNYGIRSLTEIIDFFKAIEALVLLRCEELLQRNILH